MPAETPKREAGCRASGWGEEEDTAILFAKKIANALLSRLQYKHGHRGDEEGDAEKWIGCRDER